MDNGGRLLIDLSLGDVHIESHDADEVRIELEASGLNALALSLDLSNSGDDVVLRGELGLLRVRLFDALDLNVTAFVPRDYDVHVETRNGEIEIDDVSGSVQAETRNGSIFVGFTGEPSGRLQTRHGAIDVVAPVEVGIDLEARTDRGHVYLDRKLGGAALATNALKAEIHGGGDLLQIETSHADIRIEAGEASDDYALRDDDES